MTHHGLKALAQELPKYGRFGDSIVAHINPQEAALLKSLGGSGTINPHTGLPEYFGLGSIFKGAANAVKSVVQPVYNATLKNVPGVDKALVGLDKTIGKTIPGGWGTLGTIAASFIPGMTPMMMAGLGALNGSGVMRGENKFNLQGALMGGAMAYGAGQLSQGLQAAGGGGASSLGSETANIASNLGVEGASTGAGSQAAMLAQQNAGMGLEGLNSINAGANQAIQSSLQNAAANTAGADVYSGLAGTQGAVPVTAVAQPSGLSNLATGTGQNIAAAGEGIKNLVGLGSGASQAATNFAAPVTSGGMTALVTGTAGMAQLDAQEQALKDQQAAGTITNEEYNTQMSQIEASRAKAIEAMNANPYKFSMGGMALDEASRGGAVDSEMGTDDMAMGGITGYAMGGSIPGYSGGRFLSGGGDGLSDDIPATIGEDQPAKLADGEFVISSDVVSNLGNGSSKAGAKKLYAMMDRVRQQAHGTKKQISKVDAHKVLPA